MGSNSFWITNRYFSRDFITLRRNSKINEDNSIINHGTSLWRSGMYYLVYSLFSVFSSSVNIGVLPYPIFSLPFLGVFLNIYPFLTRIKKNQEFERSALPLCSAKNLRIIFLRPERAGGNRPGQRPVVIITPYIYVVLKGQKS